MSAHDIIQDTDPRYEAVNEDLSVLGTMFFKLPSQIVGKPEEYRISCQNGSITHINPKYHF